MARTVLALEERGAPAGAPSSGVISTAGYGDSATGTSGLGGTEGIAVTVFGRTRRLAATWGALALVVLAGIACGESASTAAATPTAGAETASAPAPPQVPGTPTPTEAPTPRLEPTPTATPPDSPTPTATPTPQPTATPTPTPEAAASQGGIDWSPCESSRAFECAFVKVPADYRDPESGTLAIAVNVHRATSPRQRIGYLLVNPGGPGESGMGLVEAIRSGFPPFAAELVRHFDIVGFDPRGVGASDPKFECGAPGEQLELRLTIDAPVDTPDEVAAGEAAAGLCIESMGTVGGLLHTAYVARDMDEIRKALGVRQISYLGYSYGSALGVWYATLFPDSVRAMVVDGADNPVDAEADRQGRIADAIEETASIAGLLEKALTACDSPSCPIYNNGDPLGYFRQASEKLHLVNEASGNHSDAAWFAVVSPLYAEFLWPVLWDALYLLNEHDDPSILLEFADFQWEEDGPRVARMPEHVGCLDSWVLHPDLDRATRLADGEAFDAALDEQLPLLTLLGRPLFSPCPFYDQFAPPPLAGPLDGGGVPILVVGNHGDPVTPLIESEELIREQLSNGYLLETSHASHIVYPHNQCVKEHVHRVLIDGEYPGERRIICEREDRGLPF
ncbi:MAG: alpha/beta fold hydrolase [Chloroflexi bacterium]|nr:alpha/beta fold hydrolase [Chloroflexota bacterium]